MTAWQHNKKRFQFLPYWFLKLNFGTFVSFRYKNHFTSFSLHCFTKFSKIKIYHLFTLYSTYLASKLSTFPTLGLYYIFDTPCQINFHQDVCTIPFNSEKGISLHTFWADFWQFSKSAKDVEISIFGVGLKLEESVIVLKHWQGLADTIHKWGHKVVLFGRK